MVSVVIPNYNHEAFLKQRIDSVLNQTYRDFEIIILDDRSTDSSREVIEAYRSNARVVQILYNDKNSGSVFTQWKKGIDRARGEFIWIAESDDWADISFLEEMTKLIDSDREIGFAYCDSQIISQNASVEIFFSVTKNKILNTDKWTADYVNDGTQEIKESLLRYCTVNNASAVLFRKSVFENMDVFDRKFKFIGDWYAYVRISMKYKIAYRHKSLNFYRDHSGNGSLRLRKDFTYLIEYFMLFDWMKRNISFVNNKEIEESLDMYTHNSVFRNWSREKLKTYLTLYRISPDLFGHMLKMNLSRFLKYRLGS